MSPCNFDFSCEQIVTIRAIGESGTIEARRDTAGIHDYLVVYWMDGQRRSEWMNRWELSA